MKKLLIYGIGALLIASTMFLGSCSKERIEEEEELNEYSSMNDYMDTKKQEEQEFVITDTGSGPIVGSEGTKVWIGKSILQFPNGDTVAFPYTVKLIELYPAKEMIYYQMPTVSSGEIMSTEGEIRIRAYKDGTELMLKPNATMKVEMINSASSGSLTCLYGVDQTTYTDWTTTPATTFTSSTYGYESNIAKLGWVNCGEVVGGGTHTITFSSQTDILDNVAIFIYFPSTKGLMQVYDMSSGDIPDNASIEIICMAIDGGGDLFSHSQTISSVTANQDIDVVMTSISDTDLESELDNL